MKTKNFFFLLIMLLVSMSCRFPDFVRKSTQQVDIKLDIVKLPKEVKRGENTVFRLRTTPKNRCYGGVGYWSDDNDKWVTVKFPELIANEEGICNWEWTVSSEAKSGFIEFRAVIDQGKASKDLVPYNFCVENCPKLPLQNK